MKLRDVTFRSKTKVMFICLSSREKIKNSSFRKMDLPSLEKPKTMTILYSLDENSAVSLAQQSPDTSLFQPRASIDTEWLDFLVVQSLVGYSSYEAQHI